MVADEIWKIVFIFEVKLGSYSNGGDFDNIQKYEHKIIISRI